MTEPTFQFFYSKEAEEQDIQQENSISDHRLPGR